MNVMVYDIAAEYGGAVSVLNYFYERHKSDKTNHYFYLLSTYQLEETENITIINVPQIKRSWFHRLLFDYYGVKEYIKKFKIDEIISLQNTIVPAFTGKQTVYEHNALPFADYRFGFFEDEKMWIYQNVIGKFMINGIKKAEKVIVQTEWMKSEIVRRVPQAIDKIEIDFPKVSIPNDIHYVGDNDYIFFFPANESRFKNHRLIIDACDVLKRQGITNFKVVFTINGTENEEVSKLKSRAEAEQYDISWLGIIPRSDVFYWYTKSILVFPSYIETIGLPIYEAISIGAPVLLADCNYSHDVAKDYNQVMYFAYDNAKELAEKMLLMMETRGGILNWIN